MRTPAKEDDLGDMLVTQLDIQDLKSIEEAVAAAIARFGKIDVLVNNAGYGQLRIVRSHSARRDPATDRGQRLRRDGCNAGRAAAFPQEQARHIINISSGAGIFTLPMISLYCASKFALEGFSGAPSFELASRNIIVKIVEPHGGVTSTSFIERAAKDDLCVLPANDTSLSDYDGFLRRMSEAFAAMGAARTLSADEVAENCL
jgi:NAD(P)-dependent dehydrogenase (short-subunit alcohol dehydrogenase family)